MTKKYYFAFGLLILINNIVSGQNCPPVSTILPIAFLNNTVTLTWTANGNETQWEIIALLRGNPAPSESDTGIVVSEKPYTLTNLEMCIAYDFYIRAKCTPTTNSTWTALNNITTTIFMSQLQPPDLSACDTDKDGFVTFDLTVHYPHYLNNLDPSIFYVTYFKNAIDANFNTNPILNPESYTIPVSSEIFIHSKIRSLFHDCNAYGGFTISAWPVPDVSLNDASICFDPVTNTNASYTLDAHLPGTEYNFEWFFGETLIDGANENTLNTSIPGIYSVTATNNITGCEATAAATLSIAVMPTATATANNQTVTVSVNGQGAYHYQLDNGPIQNSNTFENVTEGTHTITIIPLHSGCSPFSITTTVTLNDPDFIFQKLRYSPNPVTQRLTISNPEPFTGISIANLLGQTVLERTVNSDLYEIDFSRLPKGVYLVRISADNQSKTFKIAKE